MGTVAVGSDSVVVCRPSFHEVILPIGEIIRAFLGATTLYDEPGTTSKLPV